MAATLQFKAVPLSRIENAVKKSLFAMKEQILTDCNYFVRVDQGILRDTAFANEDQTGILITYSQPYAKKVYYTGTPSTDVNPNASLMWCEKAYAQFGGQWQQILQLTVGQNL